MAGIVVSGVYAATQRVTLIRNEPAKVGNKTLTFLRVVPGSATRKQAMEIRVETSKGKVGYAYPKMYVNAKTGQLMANPAIQRSAVLDDYLAPQQYDPGQPERVGRDIQLSRGTTQSVEGTGFTFRDFNADRSTMMQGGNEVLVLTDVTITPHDGSKHEATLRYVHRMDGREPTAEEVEIPGVAGAFMKVIGVSPSDGTVVLRLRGISKDPAAEFQAATRESLSVEVTKKPLINLVWGGFYVMMAGGLLALWKRSREASRATVRADVEARVTSSPRPAESPALPAPARSTLPTEA
jgi:cytochrome c biogenesis factor